MVAAFSIKRLEIHTVRPTTALGFNPAFAGKTAFRQMSRRFELGASTTFVLNHSGFPRESTSSGNVPMGRAHRC
ncbi:hypothetical protein [Mesorhizobium mediterraneum]|uniref:hypothetical protein n=1 Tax=Mesorhizobium mediterraneum TaxID=43617 RepID=UPI0017835A49|nr:hypothetical protein [Mesorhizobium mediterraneum]